MGRVAEPLAHGAITRVLADGGLDAQRTLMLEIFETFNGVAEWALASTTAGSMERIRRSMRYGLYDNEFLWRVREVERRLRVDLGATRDQARAGSPGRVGRGPHASP